MADPTDKTMAAVILEEAVENLIIAREEWEESWEELFLRRGWDLAQQEARRRLAPTGSGQGIDRLQTGDNTISDPRD